MYWGPNSPAGTSMTSRGRPCLSLPPGAYTSSDSKASRISNASRLVRLLDADDILALNLWVGSCFFTYLVGRSGIPKNLFFELILFLIFQPYEIIINILSKFCVLKTRVKV